jgi:hypothetical protein
MLVGSIEFGLGEWIYMKRRSVFIFGVSALVGTLSFVPCVLAQTSAPLDTRSGSMLKDKTNDAAVAAKVKAALAGDRVTFRLCGRHPRADLGWHSYTDGGRDSAGYR